MAKKNKDDTYNCAFPHCRQESSLIWLGVGLCPHHNQWKNNNTLERAYKKLGIKPERIADNVLDEIKTDKKIKKGLKKFLTEEN
jgi:hypothetical protein